jgi:hypothetical protein
MDKAKRARTAETPKQPSPGLQLRAPYLYPDQPHVDYFAETALRISLFTFLVSTFGTAFTVLLGWRSDREFKLKIVQLQAQVAELKRQSLKDKAGTSQPLD